MVELEAKLGVPRLQRPEPAPADTAPSAAASRPSRRSCPLPATPASNTCRDSRPTKPTGTACCLDLDSRRRRSRDVGVDPPNGQSPFVPVTLIQACRLAQRAEGGEQFFREELPRFLPSRYVFLGRTPVEDRSSSPVESEPHGYARTARIAPKPRSFACRSDLSAGEGALASRALVTEVN
jgi:hypothetical protein